MASADSGPAVELILYGDDDSWLTHALETNPATMRDLGGPRRADEIPAIHRRRLDFIARGAWWFKVLPPAQTDPVGTVGVWETDWKGERIREMGWMILPRFQGRGFATAAVAAVLARARAERAFPRAHAFPALTNGASNAICRKLGFQPLEECAIDYAGRPLTCRHWRLDL